MQQRDGRADAAREQLPAAEKELAEASADFERARYRRDLAIRRYRKLRDTLETSREAEQEQERRP